MKINEPPPPLGPSTPDEPTYTFRAEYECPDCGSHGTLSLTGVKASSFTRTKDDQARQWLKIVERSNSLETVQRRFRSLVDRLFQVLERAKWDHLQGVYVLKIPKEDFLTLTKIAEVTRRVNIERD